MRLLLLAVAFASVLGVGVGLAADETARPLADGACRSPCFARKSRAYQRCRAIPPRDREARERCFRGADAALERCLAACPK